MLKGIYERFKNKADENEDEQIEYSLDPEEFKNNDEVQLGDIPPGERFSLMITSFPTTVNQFSKKKDESPVELYFLVYSLIVATLMILSIFFLHLFVTVGIAMIYAVTALPILYLYEETGMFDQATE